MDAAGNTPERAARIKEIVLAALALPADQRNAYIASACPNDIALALEARELLAAHENAGSFLGSPTKKHTDSGAAHGTQTVGSSILDQSVDAQPTEKKPAPPGDVESDATEPESTEMGEGMERPGAIIGRYKLLQKIGEGGFGEVFVAEQREPVYRRVALKIIKLGMDTRQVIARFEAERQALALMDHPCIARVLDAGATESGRPYFVMEYVKGAAITQFCDQNNLTIRERLDLFSQVCLAVQHAHQKGVIHRDIKPGNVLVFEQDGRPQAKVIDFGIAKATDRQLTDKTLFTAHEAFIGTPQYMSPEQAAGSIDIDTRTDVYSLGVLLYELLTGVTPFDAKWLRSAAYAELVRIINEVEPPKPSTRISQNAMTLESVAAQRKCEPKKLGMTIRGDLDLIVMRSLSKDRERRYATPIDFAADVKRHVGGLPVLAVPPSLAYRVKKFARRHRGLILATSATLTALIVGMVGVSVALQRALAAELQERKQKERASRLVDFQSSIFSSGGEIQFDIENMGACIRRGILEKLNATPRQDALDREIGQNDPSSIIVLGLDFSDIARSVLDESILEPTSIAARREFGDDPIARGSLQQSLGTARYAISAYDGAYELFERAYKSYSESLPASDPRVLEAQHNMAAALLQQGKSDEAKAVLASVLSAAPESLPADHPLRLRMLHNQIALVAAEQKLDEAERLCRKLLDVQRSALGPDHPDTLETVGTLGFLCARLGRYDESEKWFRNAWEAQTQVRGPDHPSTLRTISNLAEVLGALGRGAEARPLFERAAEDRRRVLGETHPETLVSVTNLAVFLAESGSVEDAIPMYRRALEGFRHALGKRHPNAIIALSNLADGLVRLKKYEEAEPLLQNCVDDAIAALGERNQVTVVAMRNLGDLYNRMNRYEDAEPILRQAMPLFSFLPGDQRTNRIFAATSLAATWNGLHRFADAEELLTSLYSELAAGDAASHVPVTDLIAAIARVYDAWHLSEPDMSHDACAAEWRNKLKSASSNAPASTQASANKDNP